MWIVPVAIMVTLLPGMSRDYATDDGPDRGAPLRGMKLIVPAGAAISIGVIVFSETIVQVVAGPEFREAAPALSVMILGTFFYFVNTVFFYTFAASNRQILSAVSWVVVAALSIILSVVLIPMDAHLGAAFAYTLSLGAGRLVNALLWVRSRASSAEHMGIGKKTIARLSLNKRA